MSGSVLNPGVRVVSVKGSIAEAIRDGIDALRPTELKQFHRVGAIAASTSETVYDSGAGKGVVIQALEWHTNELNNVRLRLRYYDEAGTLQDIRIPLSATTSTYGATDSTLMTMSVLQTFGFAMFQVTEYDVAGNKFRAINRRELAFPQGVRIDVTTASGASGTNAFVQVLVLE